MSQAQLLLPLLLLRLHKLLLYRANLQQCDV